MRRLGASLGRCSRSARRGAAARKPATPRAGASAGERRDSARSQRRRRSRGGGYLEKQARELDGRFPARKSHARPTR